MRIAIPLLFALAACGDDDPYVLRRDADAKLHPGPIYSPCEVDADCTLELTSCSGCCEMVAIATDLATRFRDERQRACEDYRGPICDCQPPPTVAACVANECAEVPKP